jgi:hypothetical protein
MAAYNLIATTTVDSPSGASTIEFSSIPQTFTDLKLVLSVRSSDGSGSLRVQPNGLTTNLSSRRLEGSGSGASSTSDASIIFVYAVTLSSYTASVFSNIEIYIPNYAGSTNKSVSADGVMENNATEAYQNLVAGLWSNTAAITSLTLAKSTGTFVQYSSASLYGIKNS